MSLLRNIHIGATGLGAASAALSATSHNVVNATTVGYQRRTVSQTTAAPTRLSIGQAGRGVSVTGFVRQGSDLLMQQQVAAEGDLARAAAKDRALSPLEPLLDETQLSGPHLATAAFFDALQAATQDPSDPALRRNVATRGSTLARSVRTTADSFDRAIAGQQELVENGVDGLNGIARKLAQVNRGIVSQGAPADLIDERDRLLKQAGALVGAKADLEPDGTANLLLDGHAVVSGTNARTVSVDAEGAVFVDVGAGKVEVAVGGELQGLQEAASVTRGLRQTLADTSAALADAMNAAHSGGFDANGDPGTDLFTYDSADPAGTLRFSASLEADTDLFAFASDATAHAGDGGNLAALVGVETQPLVGGKTASASYGGMTRELAAVVATARADSEHGAAVMDDLDMLQASLAGVDLDEEAANLMLFQTAYQASAKVIAVNDQLMDTLLEIA